MSIHASFNSSTQLVEIVSGSEKIARFKPNLAVLDDLSSYLPIILEGGSKVYVSKEDFCERFSISPQDSIISQVATEVISPMTVVAEYQRKKSLALDQLNQDLFRHEIYRIVQEFPNELEIILKAVRLDGEAICYASEELQSHPMLIVEAIKTLASAWIYVHDKPIINRDFVLRLASLNGELLAYLSPELQDDEEIVKAAIGNNVDAFSKASIRLRGNREVVLMAVEKKGSLLNDAESVFFEDQKNLEDAWLLNPDGVQDYFDEKHKSQEEQQKIVLAALRKAITHVVDEHIFDAPGRLDILTTFKWLAPTWIAKYNNGPLRSFLATSLLKILESDRLEFFLEQAHKVIDSTTHNERVLGIIGLFSMDIDEETLEKLCDFITKKKSVFKDGTKLQIILQFLKQLPSKDIPIRKIHEILYNCFIDDFKDEGVKRMSLMTAILKAKPSVVLTLSDYSSEKLVKLLLEKLKESGIIDETIVDGEQKFYQKFVETGLYASFFAYLSLHLSNPLMLAPLTSFVRSILDDTFVGFRNEHNSHLEYLTVDQRRIWQTELDHEEIEVPAEAPVAGFRGTLQETEHYRDLFLCGTEVPASCQRVDGKPELNKCLLGYCLDGKIRMLAIKDKTGKMRYRAIVKLLVDTEGKPALFLECTYPSSVSFVDDVFLNFIKKKADLMGVKLYVDGVGAILESKACIAPFEYEDNGDGVTEGSYEIHAKEYKP
jgi:hypothetical protein